MAAPIIVYSTAWCGDCRRARRVLDAHGAPYTWIDVESTPGAEAAMFQCNGGRFVVPTIAFPNGDVLLEPSTRALVARLECESAAGAATTPANEQHTPTVAGDERRPSIVARVAASVHDKLRR